MAKRLNQRHQELVRQKIKASQLIARLQKHIDAEKPILDASQVSAAKALLNKVIPDLKAIEHTGDADNPIVTKIEVEIVDPAD